MKTPSTDDMLETPCVLVDWQQVKSNIVKIAELCKDNGVRFMPHIKTHKSVAIAKLELEAGACGLTCAKIGEAEAMLASGVRRIFLAHSIASPKKIPRLLALRQKLDELILAVTSTAHAKHLDSLLKNSGQQFPVLLALDTGLGREGVRSIQELETLKECVDQSQSFSYRGIYSHEGFTYRTQPRDIPHAALGVADKLRAASKALGGGELWPGCSVTVKHIVKQKGMTGVRPGAFVFGDIVLSLGTHSMEWEDLALCVASTVIDKPEKGLALIDAGTKVFSSDKNPNYPNAIPLDQSDYALTRMSEEHGMLTGPAVDSLHIGQIVYLIPTHVCPVINLTHHIQILDDKGNMRPSIVDARGAVT